MIHSLINAVHREERTVKLNGKVSTARSGGDESLEHIRTSGHFGRGSAKRPNPTAIPEGVPPGLVLLLSAPNVAVTANDAGVETRAPRS